MKMGEPSRMKTHYENYYYMKIHLASRRIHYADTIDFGWALHFVQADSGLNVRQHCKLN